MTPSLKILLALLWSFIILGTGSTQAADISSYTPLCKQGHYQLCGYYDQDTHEKDEPIEWLIPPQYEIAYEFSEGLAVVRINGQYGFINQDGDFVIKPKYDFAGSFFSGLAPFFSNQSIGFINKAGKIVVPPKFTNAVAISDTIIIGREGQLPEGHIPRELESIGPGPKHPMRFLLDISSSKNLGIYHIEEGWLTKQEYSFGQFDKINHKFLWAGKKNEPIGLMRMDGTWHQNPQYVYAARLIEGLAIVRIKDDDGKILSGAVNENGDLVVPTEFEWLGYSAGGYGLTQTGDLRNPVSLKYGLVDKTGKLLGGRYFDEVERPDISFNATETVFLPRVRIEDTWHSITPEGTLIGDQKLEDEIANGPFHQCENYTIIRTEDGLVAYDKAGKHISNLGLNPRLSFLIPPHGSISGKTCEFPVKISYHKKYGFILTDGTLFADRLFDSTGALYDNVAAYAEGEKWGLIEKSGRVVLEPQFKNIRWYGDGLYRVNADKESFLVDKHGTRQELSDDPRYNKEFDIRLPPRSDYLTCPGGTKLKSKNGKWGLVTDEGKMVLPFKYRALLCYHDGLSWAPDDERGEWCPIGPDGQSVSHIPCREKRYPTFAHHYSHQKLADNQYESSVLWTLAYLNYGEGLIPEPPRLENHVIGLKSNLADAPPYRFD